MGGRVVYFDMDGLTTDFLTGALAAHGAHIPVTEAKWEFWDQIGFTKETAHHFWAPLAAREFWRDLLPLDDGMELFRRVESAIGKDRVTILSSANLPNARDGKCEWLDRHLPGYSKKAIFANAKYYCAAPSKVLIDDADHNVEAFRAHGGRAVLVPRPWNAHKHLSDAQGRFQVAQVLDELIPLIERD